MTRLDLDQGSGSPKFSNKWAIFEVLSLLMLSNSIIILFIKHIRLQLILYSSKDQKVDRDCGLDSRSEIPKLFAIKLP